MRIFAGVPREGGDVVSNDSVVVDDGIFIVLDCATSSPYYGAILSVSERP